MASPLTKDQKQTLAMLARRAFDVEGAKARGRGEQWNGDSAHFEEWRHEHVAKACGKVGLRCCTQLDYRAVRGHFNDLLGNTRAAFEDNYAAQTEPLRQAQAVLVRELKVAGLSINYAIAIAQRQYRCTLDDLNRNQVWSLIYTIRNRAAAKRRQPQAA